MYIINICSRYYIDNNLNNSISYTIFSVMKLISVQNVGFIIKTSGQIFIFEHGYRISEVIIMIMI